jgi:hypothetical protein
MSPVRIYLPASLPALSARLAVGASGAPGTPVGPVGGAGVADPGAIAYAVTPALREWYRDGDLEELEYAALTRAAHASLRSLVDSRVAAAQARRVVLAADLPDAQVTAASEIDVAAVRLLAPVLLAAVAAVHVDDPAAVPDVSAAMAVLDAAEAGDDDARFTVDGLDDHELQWYAVQELDSLLG